MKRHIVSLGLALTLMIGVTVQSCGDKKKKTETTTTTTTTTTDNNAGTTTAPVTVSGDEDLRRGVTDATKDFPGVTATVTNGEINLTGTIQRDRLPTLMQSLSSLQAKRINNNLTLQ
jgi:outer membrane receptor for ferrienterochelin and colicin